MQSKFLTRLVNRSQVKMPKGLCNISTSNIKAYRLNSFYDLLRMDFFMFYILHNFGFVLLYLHYKWPIGPYAFWATVCKTVRPMLSDRCMSCPVLSVLSCL